ncbi:hypothetical protein ABW19_dt0200995 [Dactylella cylindrospora]|nr:hypothetical protein ABW19_dt0200995 [Dactylella cylindrospora]
MVNVGIFATGFLGTAELFGQCGGRGWKGPTKCPGRSNCVQAGGGKGMKKCMPKFKFDIRLKEPGKDELEENTPRKPITVNFNATISTILVIPTASQSLIETTLATITRESQTATNTGMPQMFQAVEIH